VTGPSGRPGPRAAAALAAAIVGGVALAGCGGESADAGGLTSDDRDGAQAAMNALQKSNLPIQLVSLTTVAGVSPAACRVRLVSKTPRTYRVYVFWAPHERSRPYSWLDMTITGDPTEDEFHLGTSPPTLEEGSAEATAAADRRAMLAHSGGVFAKPGGRCRVLMNGYLELLPST